MSRKSPNLGYTGVGQAFRPKVTIFVNFLYIFAKFRNFRKIRGGQLPENRPALGKASPATPRADCPKKSSVLARVINITRDPPKSPKRSKSPGRPRNFPAGVAPDFPRRPPATPGDLRKKHEKRPLFKCLQVRKRLKHPRFSGVFREFPGGKIGIFRDFKCFPVTGTCFLDLFRDQNSRKI